MKSGEQIINKYLSFCCKKINHYSLIFHSRKVYTVQSCEIKLKSYTQMRISGIFLLITFLLPLKKKKKNGIKNKYIIINSRLNLVGLL